MASPWPVVTLRSPGLKVRMADIIARLEELLLPAGSRHRLARDHAAVLVKAAKSPGSRTAFGSRRAAVAAASR